MGGCCSTPHKRRLPMGMYMGRFSYAPEAVQSMIDNPKDRSEAVGNTVEACGGKLQGIWYTFGSQDGYALCEFPDDASAAAFSITVGASGALSSYETIPLMSTADAVQAFERAASVSYVAPGN